MRVNPYPMPDLLAALNHTELEAQQAGLQISTGRSVNVPSDDPTAAAQLVENNDQASVNRGYLADLTAINGQLSAASSTLNSVQSALQQAISLGVEAGNGTLSDSDRASIVSELQGIQSQILSLANTSYQGNYLFSGTATSTAPYAVSGTDPSGVSYAGNDGVNQVSVGAGYQVAVNQPGSQLFSASGNSVFLALNELIVAVQSNTGVETALPALDSAANYLSVQAVFYGNALSQVQSQTTYQNAAKLQIEQQQNSLGAVDMATAANTLSQAQTDTQAALEAISKFSGNSLFDYLR
ncbi:MAG TPA: flagellar hook-associated protein FlgL [Terriglobales bacterium]|nr:flagellar hook-associated protein FlgL [Terriglobales bacterium]